MRFNFSILCFLLLSMNVSLALAEEKITTPTKEQVKFFETEVRPVLATHCYKCHGAEKQEGELRIDSLQALLKGGESGEAVVPGKLDDSLLIDAINYESFEMPPGKQLDDASIAALTKWVTMGAPWPTTTAKQKPFDWIASSKMKFTEEDRAFWLFQPVGNPAVPEVADARWQKNPVDRFIYRKMKAAGISPAPAADRLTLIRRASFDLTGLPPTPAEVDRFLNDSASDEIAFAKVVDRLLESPHYGEQWGRHWLDLVRYAESDGFNQDAYRPTAWHYRDYVVQSFNADKPYDQFVQEQLAGDEIAPNDPSALVATGYLRHYIYEYNQRDARTQWDDILNNITDTTGEVFLGMGMSCARCHDHKFDPIPQDDYFRLKAFFAPLLPKDDVPLATPAQKAEYDRKMKIWEEKTADLRAKIDDYLKERLVSVAGKQIKMFPPDIQEIMAKPEQQRTTHEMQLAYLVNRQVTDKINAYLKAILKQKKHAEYAKLVKQLAEFDHLKPKPFPTAPSVTETSAKPPVTTIPGTQSEQGIAPGFISILSPDPVDILPPPQNKIGTGRRTILAKWLTRPDNRITTRVITNRIWQYHFGTGFVATANDFGHLGELPSHPELLDWLTTQFINHDWSFKQMHRLIMNTETYRLSAKHPHPQQGEMKDPANRLHWRGDIRRLTAEQIRDSALAVSGELKLELGGASVKGNVPRRSIYVIIKRNTKDEVLGAFDFAGGITSTAHRNVTTTPTQALLMINGEWLLKRAGAMADRIAKMELKTEAAQIEAAYKLTYGRSPNQTELQTLIPFLKNQKSDQTDQQALIDLCHVLLNSNEFLYIE